MAKKGQKLSEETKKRITLNHSHYWKGKKFSKAVVKQRSVVAKLRGFGKWMRGRKLSKATRLKMGISREGSRNPSWKHGLSKTKPYKSFYDRLCRARRVGASGSHTFAEWETLKAQYNWTCPCCGKPEPEIKLTIDHIIPVARGGSNNVENIQPLCGRCNSVKNAKTIKFPWVR